MWQGFLLRWVQTCFLWTFSESPLEAGLNSPKQKSQDHARPVVVWGGSRARAHSLRQGLPPIVQELFLTHPTYQNPIFINPRPPFMYFFRFFIFSAYWTPIGPLLDPYWINYKSCWYVHGCSWFVHGFLKELDFKELDIHRYS